ncbi:nuclear transport factor 2 family protein [Cognatishimia sp. WU-CL00825]|uniref:nuclear transport factor 2 family protein n=1 Tax=Cognatishimia sp. WU-CL00825 TaxID=3127658 RepID=UPI00310A1FDD
MTPTEIVLAAVSALFINFDQQAATELLDPGYIQHNPYVPTGAAPIIGFIPALKESGLEITTHRVIAEGDLVVTHNTYENAQLFGAEAWVAFDIFRVANGKVIEHWDNLQVPVVETASGRSMVDGATEITDLDKTAENKALVTAFVTDVLHGKAPDKITDYISATHYHQHNPNVADGLEGLGAFIGYLTKNNIAFAYTDTPIIVAQGNFVFTASEGVFGDAPTAFFDLFRVENGKIVEHWDTISEIPSEMAHENGKL